MTHSRLKLILLLFLLMSCLLSSRLGARQSSTALPKPRNDRQQEDAVAKLFDQVRKDAKLHRLRRIEDRTLLQQLVCTVAVTDKVPRFRYGFPVLGNNSIDGVTNEKQAGNSAAKADQPSALYKTTNPGEITPELKRVALFERPRGRSGHTLGYARYAVAVWPAQQSANEKAEYWVSVDLFWSAGNEFFLNHFSDAMEWKNEWKTFVTPGMPRREIARQSVEKSRFHSSTIVGQFPTPRSRPKSIAFRVYKVRLKSGYAF